MPESPTEPSAYEMPEAIDEVAQLLFAEHAHARIEWKQLSPEQQDFWHVLANVWLHTHSIAAVNDFARGLGATPMRTSLENLTQTR